MTEQQNVEGKSRAGVFETAAGIPGILAKERAVGTWLL